MHSVGLYMTFVDEFLGMREKKSSVYTFGAKSLELEDDDDD